jgi:hypothetical protein
MKTKVFLLSFCLGAGMAELLTTQPAQIINDLLINGCNVSKVTIKNA